jgi:hypothetical protein
VPNTVLRQAMAARKMRPADLASVAEVDPKTVEAWLRDESRVPHPDARYAVAAALEMSEMTLWPQAVRAAVKVGADKEIISVYPTRSAMPASVWQRMIGDATEEIALCGYTSYFLWLAVPDLSAVLRSKAEAGTRVRVVIGDPDSALTARSEETESTPLSTSQRIAHARHELESLADAIEVRQSDLGLGRSVWRGDAQAVASWNVLGTLGHESPVFHLRRHQNGGVFDQMAVRHVDALWQAAVPVWP